MLGGLDGNSLAVAIGARLSGIRPCPNLLCCLSNEAVGRWNLSGPGRDTSLDEPTQTEAPMPDYGTGTFLLANVANLGWAISRPGKFGASCCELRLRSVSTPTRSVRSSRRSPVGVRYPRIACKSSGRLSRMDRRCDL
jgi:hypothetical protein